MRIHRAVWSLSVLVAGIALNVWNCPDVSSQNAPPVAGGKGTASYLLYKMVGTWNVRQRMWPGYGEKPVELPAATAQRHLVEGAFLEEVMALEKGSSQKPFTRIAYFNFNAVSRQYEYFSLDTRAPQMMNERSRKVSARSEAPEKGEIALDGGHFIAPEWGKAKNVAFTYRLTVGAIEKDNQVVRLYLKPEAGSNVKEFLAFEYVYTRRP